LGIKKINSFNTKLTYKIVNGGYLKWRRPNIAKDLIHQIPKLDSNTYKLSKTELEAY